MYSLCEHPLSVCTFCNVVPTLQKLNKYKKWSNKVLLKGTFPSSWYMRNVIKYSQICKYKYKMLNLFSMHDVWTLIMYYVYSSCAVCTPVFDGSPMCTDCVLRVLIVYCVYWLCTVCTDCVLYVLSVYCVYWLCSGWLCTLVALCVL